MATSFSSRVPHVRSRSPVSASNTGAATRALEQRTNFLRDSLNGITSRSLVVHEDQPIDSSVVAGEAVFWNDETSQYEGALAAVETDTATGQFSVAASSDVLGLVLQKTSSTRGTIACLGFARFTATTILAATGDDGAAGKYYLSATSPGKMSRQRPPVTVAVMLVLGVVADCETDVWVFIFPQLRDFLEDHVHYQFSLTAQPAGTHTPPLFGDPHEITDADASLPGWLPAGHSSFSGNAPTGAVWGYNIAADESLSRIWPPLPPTAAILEIFHDGNDDLPVGGRVLPEFVKFDVNGIWWLTDCYGQVPWPTDYDSAASASASSASATCPVTAAFQLLLSFTKMTFATNKSVVTSLAPDTDSPIELVNCDGVVATTGDLLIRLNEQTRIDNNGLELAPANFVVDGVTIGDLLGVAYHEFPAGSTTSLRIRFDIPYTGLPTTPQFSLRALLFGGGVGPLCELTVGYYRVIAPVVGTPTLLDSGDTLVDFDVTTPSATLAAESAIQVDSESFTVAAGDTVFVEIGRAVDAAPDYAELIGLIRVAGILSAGE